MIRHELVARLHMADHWQVSFIRWDLLSASFMRVGSMGLLATGGRFSRTAQGHVTRTAHRDRHFR
jgi:hypothetical protein